MTRTCSRLVFWSDDIQCVKNIETNWNRKVFLGRNKWWIRYNPRCARDFCFSFIFAHCSADTCIKRNKIKTSASKLLRLVSARIAQCCFVFSATIVRHVLRFATNYVLKSSWPTALKLCQFLSMQLASKLLYSCL